MINKRWQMRIKKKPRTIHYQEEGWEMMGVCDAGPMWKKELFPGVEGLIDLNQTSFTGHGSGIPSLMIGSDDLVPVLMAMHWLHWIPDKVLYWSRFGPNGERSCVGASDVIQNMETFRNFGYEVEPNDGTIRVPPPIDRRKF